MQKSMDKRNKSKTRWEDVECKVDDKPPRLPVTMVTKPQLLNLIAQEQRLLDLANVDLLRRLYKIHVEHGKTSTFRSRPLPKPKSNFQTRKAEAAHIEADNLDIANSIALVTPKVPTIEELKHDWEHSKKVIKTKMKYPAYWMRQTTEERVANIPKPLQMVQYITEKSLKYPDERPRVSIEVSLEKFGARGRMTAILYSDYVPRTCENFLAFCESTNNLSYLGCKIYHIVPQFFCVTGDVVHNKGLGGTSIYGKSFKHENYLLQHGEPGVLSMDNTGESRNSSQFLITFRPLHSMDNRYVAFGKIVQGLKTVMDIESFGTKGGHPLKTFWISDIKEI